MDHKPETSSLFTIILNIIQLTPLALLFQRSRQPSYLSVTLDLYMFRGSTWTCLLRPDSSERFSPSQTSSYWWHHSQSIASQIRAVGKKSVSLIGWNCYSLTYDTLDNDFWIENDFTKYLKNCFKSSNLYLPLKYFPNYAFGWKILAKLSGGFWLLWAF